MNFKKINLTGSWIVFAISLSVYFDTIEPTVSFWDCGEFIACANKLEIGHQPGAPFFLLLGRIFSLFAGNQTEKIAFSINSISAIASAFAIFFLYKTIVILCERIYSRRDSITEILITGAALTGSLICAFSDTFWFSAVEGEVYATSLLFTSFIFWAMLKWAEDSSASGKSTTADSWIILIFYLMGLSVGIHLLNLLCLPALAAIFYFTKNKPQIGGFLKSQLVAFLLLGTIVFMLIPGIVKVAAWFDLFFVNRLSLPVNSGALFYIALLMGALVFLLYFSHMKSRTQLNKVLIAMVVFIIGYSTYILLPVRASANPPINLNKVNNPYSLLRYINREQYVSRPLFYGPYYNTPITGYKEKKTKVPVHGRYEEMPANGEYRYDKSKMVVFPRMASMDPADVNGYKKWINNPKNPSFTDNLAFFFKYQAGYMYWRYFMWNFAGRQNDIQGRGDILNGNWICGIPLIDAMRLGPQHKFPEWRKQNKGRNVYYLLPLLLGIAGAFFHYRNNSRDFIPVLIFFFFTGLAIVIYLNEIPVTPRERDYAVGGSFYVYCIWTGIGTLFLFSWLRKVLPGYAAALLSIIVSLFIPLWMALENYDDHDRSGRYVARDVAYNYLNSCDKNAILFTNADNDTYPLWYAQETEGIRTDVRLILAPFLTADWYIEKLTDWHNEAAPVEMIISTDKYASGNLNYVPYYKRLADPAPAISLLEFIGSDDPRALIKTDRELQINYYPVDKVLFQNVEAGTEQVVATLNNKGLYKHTIAALDIIAANIGKRPIYFLSTQLPDELGLSDYLQLDGFAYKLIPEKIKANNHLTAGKIDTESLYDKLMNRFKWGNMNDPGVYVDENCIRTTNILGIRNVFARLAMNLIESGQKDRAVEALDYCMELLPHWSVPPDYLTLGIIMAYIEAGEVEKARAIMHEYKTIIQQDSKYFASLKPKQARQLQYEISSVNYINEWLTGMEKQIAEKNP